jgi:hypothetical protein
MVPGYYFQEISAERFVLLNTSTSVPFTPSKRWDLAVNTGIAKVDFLPGARAPRKLALWRRGRHRLHLLPRGRGAGCWATPTASTRSATAITARTAYWPRRRGRRSTWERVAEARLRDAVHPPEPEHLARLRPALRPLKAPKVGWASRRSSVSCLRCAFRMSQGKIERRRERRPALTKCLSQPFFSRRLDLRTLTPT